MAVAVARFSRQRREKFTQSNNATIKSTENKSKISKRNEFEERSRQAEILDYQFNLHALANPAKPKLILLKLPFCTHVLHVDLRGLRLFFFLLNIVVIYSAVQTFNAWIKIDGIKHATTRGLTQAQKDRDSFYLPHKFMHDNFHMIDEGFTHSDQILFGLGVILVLYYVIFGIFVPIRYEKLGS